MTFLEKLKEKLNRFSDRIKSFIDKKIKSKISNWIENIKERRRVKDSEGKIIEPKVPDIDDEVKPERLIEEKLIKEEETLEPNTELTSDDEILDVDDTLEEEEIFVLPKPTTIPALNFTKIETTQDQDITDGIDQILIEKSALVDISDEEFPEEPDIESKDEEEVKRKKKPINKIRQDAIIFLDLYDGGMKLQIPIISFSDYNAFKEASPIICKVKVKDINNQEKTQLFDLKQEKFKIENSDAEPFIIDLVIFKSVYCEIESRNKKLNKKFYFSNSNENFFIFKEEYHSVPFIKDFSDFFERRSYFWIMIKKDLVIEPKPKIFSYYVAYENYDLKCISLDSETNRIQILDKENHALKEIYKLPKLILKSTEVVYDEFFDKNPIFSSSFEIILEDSEAADEFPKKIHIRDVGIKETKDYGMLNEDKKWNSGKSLEISPETFKNKIGNFQIDLVYYTDESYKKNKFKPITKLFRYCPIYVEREIDTLAPGSTKYIYYPISIKTKGDQEFSIETDIIDLEYEEINNSGFKFEYKGIIPQKIDNIIIRVDSEDNINPILVYIKVPRPKWRLDGLKKYSKFTGKIINLDYEELLDRNVLNIQVKPSSSKKIRNLKLTRKNEQYEFSYIKKRYVYECQLKSIILKKIIRLLEGGNSVIFSLQTEKFEIPIIQINPDISKDEIQKKERIESSIKDPYVEFDFNREYIYLIIPKQILKSHTTAKTIEYQVKINNHDFNKTARVIRRDQETIEIERKEFEIKDPLREFKIDYPEEFYGLKILRGYIHGEPRIYIFKREVGGISRMEYICHEDGDFKAIPKKREWVIHCDNLEVVAPIKAKTFKVWNYDAPKWIDLRDKKYLVLKEKESGQLIEFPCVTKFYLAGRKLDVDIKGEGFPFFTGNQIEVNSSKNNLNGWEIWIKNKNQSKKLVNNWTGDKAFVINCPNDLLCEFGEFKVEIYKKGTNKLVQRLYFRYIKYINVEYKKKLILPLETGHRPIETIHVSYGQDYKKWMLVRPEGVAYMRDDQNKRDTMTVPINIDNVKFSIFKKDRPEAKISMEIQIPRLKWRLGGQGEWSGKIKTITREEFRNILDSYIIELTTNDLNNSYIVKSLIRDQNKNKKIDEISLKRKRLIGYECDFKNSLEKIIKNLNDLNLTFCLINENDKTQEFQVDYLKIIKQDSIDIDLSEIYSDDAEIEDQEIVLEEPEEKQFELSELNKIEIEEEETDVTGPKVSVPKFSKLKIQKAPLESSAAFIGTKRTSYYINHVLNCINTFNKCELKARGNAISNAVFVSEMVQSIYTGRLNYEEVKIYTQNLNGKFVSAINVKLNTKKVKTISRRPSVKNKDTLMYVGGKLSEWKYNKIAQKILNSHGICIIQARGRYISKTAVVCEMIIRKSQNSINYEEILLYIDELEGHPVSAISVKLSTSRKKKKLGVKYQVGGSIFDL